MLNPYGVHAAREYLLEGNFITRLEAMVLFAVPDLTKIISDLRTKATTWSGARFHSLAPSGG
jgi:hypothetical protein